MCNNVGLLVLVDHMANAPRNGEVLAMFSKNEILRNPLCRIIIGAILAVSGVAPLCGQQTEQQVVIDKDTMQLLLKRIDQLEARVRQLEADKQQAAADPPAVKADPLPPAAASRAAAMQAA